ncbi:MAG: phage tail sheath subtilisin-like domain-containing protein [Xanthomonadales bacterium]|jgi:hypothetical protein|nr:phage tail sheath subtilisin-like domain-containing protein [Xanthomonadales bacterium]
MGALYDASVKRGSAPGVRFEETAPKKKSLLQTGVPLFVGFGQIGGEGESAREIARGIRALEFTSWEGFEQAIRVGLSGGFLDYAIRGFFQNGGQRCVVVALPGVAGMPRTFEKLFEDKGALEEIEDVDLVCVPDIMAPEAQISSDKVANLQQQVLAYCRRMGDRFAILDAARIPDADEPGGVPSASRNQDDWRRQLLARQSTLPNKGGPVEGAIYFPWIHVQPLPRHRHALRTGVPPCGHIAGIYARSDAAFGIHKAPANEIIEDAMDLDMHLSNADQVELNDFGVNCLRSFPGRGIRVWGARTLSGRLDWKYVNVRRLFLTLVRWSAHHLNDLVFEPNGEPLWHRVRDRVGNYCHELYQSGALKGQTPAEAYFVKCDAETNPLAVRANGELICEVGLAPVVPAEFIVVRITQSPAGATANISTGI